MSFPAKATKKAPLWGSLPYLRCLPSFFPVGIRRQEQVHVARNLHFQVIFLHNALAGSRSHRAHGIRAGQQLRRHIGKHIVIPEITQEPVFARTGSVSELTSRQPQLMDSNSPAESANGAVKYTCTVEARNNSRYSS